jgi:hypothetical protein
MSMRRTILYPIVLGFFTTMAHAGPGDVYPGDTFHAAPFDFLFGNHIDTHQQLKLKTKSAGKPSTLKGSFYIIFTDDQGAPLGTDPESGLPIARHPRGLVLEDDGVTIRHDEACGLSANIVCVAGWQMRGLSGAAKFVSHEGVNGDDHPIWMVNRAEEALAPAAGMVIPQPGSYTHFHWITRNSNDPRAALVLDPCDKKNAGQLEDQAPAAVNEVCEGWFLEIKAVEDFAFEHGGEIIPVRKGIDNRSHLNLVTNYQSLPAGTITTTRD